MTDNSPDDIIDYSGTPRSLGEQRDYGFMIMKKRMMEIYSKKMAHAPPLTRGTAMKAYEQGINDAFSVFAQVVDVPTNEELSPG